MSITNPDKASEAQAALAQREALGGHSVDEAMDRQDALATKRRLEQRQRDETEPVAIEVDGEEIMMEPLAGLGQKVSLPKRLLEAERSGDEYQRLAALDDMIGTLAEQAVHADIFDRGFWDGLGEETLTDAYQDLALKSRGGPDAGN